MPERYDMYSRLISNTSGPQGGDTRRLPRIVAASATLAIAGSLVASTGPAALADSPGRSAATVNAEQAGQATTTKWTTGMGLRRPGGCWLYPGLRNKTQPITGHQWHHSQGYRVGWRYRVNKAWSLVLDYGRTDVKHKSRWAFVETSCLNGNQYPARAKDSHGRVRNLWGKGSHHWRHVRFGTSRPSGIHTIGTRTVVAAYTTMRDKPQAFVVGNLFTHDQFKITNRCTSHHKDHGHNPWIYGLDLQSQRWGWVSSGALQGNPCLTH
jgi:hypothetical protein